MFADIHHLHVLTQVVPLIRQLALKKVKAQAIFLSVTDKSLNHELFVSVQSLLVTPPIITGDDMWGTGSATLITGVDAPGTVNVFTGTVLAHRDLESSGTIAAQ